MSHLISDASLLYEYAADNYQIYFESMLGENVVQLSLKDQASTKNLAWVSYLNYQEKDVWVSYCDMLKTLLAPLESRLTGIYQFKIFISEHNNPTINFQPQSFITYIKNTIKNLHQGDALPIVTQGICGMLTKLSDEGYGRIIINGAVDVNPRHPEQLYLLIKHIMEKNIVQIQNDLMTDIVLFDLSQNKLFDQSNQKQQHQINHYLEKLRETEPHKIQSITMCDFQKQKTLYQQLQLGLGF